MTPHQLPTSGFELIWMPRQLEGDQEIVDVEADVDGLRRGHNITLSLGQNGNLTNPLLVHRSHSSLRIYTIYIVDTIPSYTIP